MYRTRDRLAGVTAAVLLQLGLVTIFLYSLPLIAPPKKLAREIIFLLPRLRETSKPARPPRRTRPSLAVPNPAAPSIAVPPLALPPLALPPIILSPPTNDLQTFGKDLFGCAPEQLGKLRPDERAHCSTFAMPPATAMTEPPSLVKDLPRRQAELAAKNTPPRVPCMGIKSQALASGHQDTGFMVDPLCVLNGLINGFDNGLPP